MSLSATERTSHSPLSLVPVQRAPAGEDWRVTVERWLEGYPLSIRNQVIACVEADAEIVDQPRAPVTYALVLAYLDEVCDLALFGT